MASERQRINSLMRRVRLSGGLPSSSQIVDETFQRLGYIEGSIEPEYVLENFNELLRTLWVHTLVTLEEYEQLSYAEGIPKEFIEEFPEDFRLSEQMAAERGFKEGVIQLIKSWYPFLRRAFLSVSQSRMQRGGKDFELQIEGLLSLAKVPFHKQERENRTDLIIPNLETHQRNRTISAIVSIKRTLRERWAEVAEELFNLRSPNVFLFTADENISGNHIERICGQYNIHLVVWDSEKATKFTDKPLVLGYTDWAKNRLSILRQNWR